MAYYLRKFILFLVQVLIVLAVIGGFAYYAKDVRDEKMVSEQKEAAFPQLSAPATKSYVWKYGGREYELSQALHGSSYDFYRKSPKNFSYTGTLPDRWQEQYYGMFLNVHKEDDIITSIAEKLRILGEKNKLSNDQLAELVLAFVQAIPYDDAKAELINKQGKDETVRYPYEVLFENSGICSEKSLLTVALLRSLGFGATLFAFEQDNHMAVGVQCPKEYSNYASGYCYAETTAVGHKIGIIPTIDPSRSGAIAVRELGSFEQEASASSGKELGFADVYQQTIGGEYRGIITTIKINQEIQQLQRDIATLKTKLSNMQKDMRDLEDELAAIYNDMKKYEKRGDLDAYNKLVEPYNKKVKENKKLIESYNLLVNQYNSKVTRYNSLIRQ